MLFNTGNRAMTIDAAGRHSALPLSWLVSSVTAATDDPVTVSYWALRVGSLYLWNTLPMPVRASSLSTLESVCEARGCDKGDLTRVKRVRTEEAGPPH